MARGQPPHLERVSRKPGSPTRSTPRPYPPERHRVVLPLAAAGGLAIDR
jgi:hypothetical protein